MSLQVWIFQYIVSWPIDFETMVREQFIAEAQSSGRKSHFTMARKCKNGKGLGLNFVFIEMPLTANFLPPRSTSRRDNAVPIFLKMKSSSSMPGTLQSIPDPDNSIYISVKLCYSMHKEKLDSQSLLLHLYTL